jgi:hypothetical protein
MEVGIKESPGFSLPGLSLSRPGGNLIPERWHEEHSSPGRNCAKT